MQVNNPNLSQDIVSAAPLEQANFADKIGFRDRYRSIQELLASTSEQNYCIDYCNRGTQVLLVAPHGGKLEPGTSQLVKALAGESYSYYDFQGLTDKFDPEVHVASTRFDCPYLQPLLNQAELALTFHGCCDPGQTVYLGGLDRENIQNLWHRLETAGFKVAEHVYHRGVSSKNICNRARSGKGIQVELSNDWQLELTSTEKTEAAKALLVTFTGFIFDLEYSLRPER